MSLQRASAVTQALLASVVLRTLHSPTEEILNDFKYLKHKAESFVSVVAEWLSRWLSGRVLLLMQETGV